MKHRRPEKSLYDCMREAGKKKPERRSERRTSDGSNEQRRKRQKGQLHDRTPEDGYVCLFLLSIFLLPHDEGGRRSWDMRGIYFVTRR
jgi:hypothetical protein